MFTLSNVQKFFGILFAIILIPIQAFCGNELLIGSPEQKLVPPTSPTTMVNSTTTTSTTNPVTGGCDKYSIDVEFMGRGNGGDVSLTNESAPSCLKQFIAEKQKNCVDKGFLWGDHRGRNGNHFGSCLLIELSGRDGKYDWDTFFSGYDYNGYYDTTYSLTYDTHGNIVKGTRQGYEQLYGPYMYKDKIFYDVDENGVCSVIDPPGNVNICEVAKLTWYVSPISLLINIDEDRFREESSIVKFALNPNRGSYSFWRGSQEAPLLVYDPEHKGHVEGPAQLFGNWTFGGKREASIKGDSGTSSDQNKSSVAWNHGFEALGTLDQNNDGKVSGDELAPLALWFDENRNGISEKGEVRDIREVGITALYYKQFTQEPISKDLVANIGYDRLVDGKLVQGKSIDWYSISAQTEMELTQKQLGLNSLCSDNRNEVETANSTKQDIVQEDSVGKVVVENGFLNTWSWKSDSENSDTGGVLVFAKNPKGGIVGISMLELGLGNKSQRIIFNAKLNAQIVRDIKDAKNSIVFTHKDQDGTVVESKAFLSDDNKSLKGESNVFTLNGNNKKVSRASYKWTAQVYQ